MTLTVHRKRRKQRREAERLSRAAGVVALAVRDREQNKLAVRSITIPKTLDEATRSVDIIAATETPVNEYDWHTGETWPTVLLPDGARLNRRELPLLDNHNRWSVTDTLGTNSNPRLIDDASVGRSLVYTMTISAAEQRVWTKVKEGHLKNVSVGRKDGDLYPMEYAQPEYVPAGQTKVIKGRSFTGPVRVIADWEPIEVSIANLGADPNAQVRSEESGGSLPASSQQKESLTMNPQLRALLVKRGLAADATEAAAYAFLGQLLATRSVVFSTDAAALELLNQPEPTANTANRSDSGNTAAAAPVAPANDATVNRAAPSTVVVPAAAASLPSAAPVQSPDPLIAERQRATNIYALCEELHVDRSVAEDLVTRGIGYGEAIPIIRSKRPNQPATEGAAGGSGAPNVTRNEVESLADQVEVGLMLRAFGGDARAAYGERAANMQISNQARRFSQASLLEVSRSVLRCQGHPVDDMNDYDVAVVALRGESFNRIPQGMTAGALLKHYAKRSTGISLGVLPAVVATTTNSVLGRGFMEAPYQWSEWVIRDEPLKDFEEQNVVQGDMGGLLAEIPENEPAAQRKLVNPQVEKIKAKKLGESIPFSFEALMGDKLGWLHRQIRGRGAAGSRTINFDAISLLTGNPVMNTDSVALFDSAHGNLLASGAAPDTDQLAAMDLKLGLQTGLETIQVLGLELKKLLVPKTLRYKAEKFALSPVEPGASNEGVPNQFARRGIQVIADGMLDAASTVVWYGFGDLNLQPVIVIKFLSGFEIGVFLEEVYDPKTMTREYITRIFYGIAAVDWRNAVKNPGQ